MGIIKFFTIPATWYKGKNPPDDHRDVLAYCKRPVYNDKMKRLEAMNQMQVLHYQDEAWWWEGRKLDTKQVLKWTEIPTGWND